MTTAGRQFSVNNSQLLISCCHFFAVFPVPLEHLEESCVMGPFKCSQESPSVIFLFLDIWASEKKMWGF